MRVPSLDAKRRCAASNPSICAHGSRGWGGSWPDLLLPPSCRHDDIIGKISLSKEAITADPRGEQGVACRRGRMG